MAPFLELCHALDPVGFARERLSFQPDLIQALVLASRSKQVILNCTRQWGKSTLTAAQAVFTAWHEPESLILVMSHTEPQAGELVKTSLLLPKRSHIVGLPGDEAGDCGFSGVLSRTGRRSLQRLYRLPGAGLRNEPTEPAKSQLNGKQRALNGDQKQGNPTHEHIYIPDPTR